MDSRRLLWLVLASVLLSLGIHLPRLAAQHKAKRFEIRQEDSNIGFSVIKWLVVREEGRFREFSGWIMFDPEDPAATSVDVTIQTASIDSRNDGRDRALRSEGYLNVRRYPAMTFKSVAARRGDGNTMLVDGDLTIRGVTKRITIPVRTLGVQYVDEHVGVVAGFEATLSIDRKEFNVGPESTMMIGGDVTIHLMIGANSRHVHARR
jgi:polyisoprenoid-binding protein YceI